MLDLDDKNERSYVKDYQESIRHRKMLKALEEANLRDRQKQEAIASWKQEFLKNEAVAIAAAKRAYDILYGC